MKGGHVVLLSGGVGGAKLADGLAQCLPPGKLTIVVNTGDDFTHLGLRICPDIDSVSYMLAGLNDEERGWGRRNETWRCLEAVRQLGGPDWFRLGDQDIALHLIRSSLLKEGRSLSEVTAEIAAQMGIRHRVVPMTDATVETVLQMPGGEEMAFQDYFVRNQCRPRITGVKYRSACSSTMSDAMNDALQRNDLAGIVIAPSNPLLSIGPILAIAGVKAKMAERKVPVVAVSPLIGGAAVKGPAAKIMKETGFTPGNQGIAEYYKGLLDGLVIHSMDEGPDGRGGLDIAVKAGNTMMDTAYDRQMVAQMALDLVRELAQ